MTTIAWDGKTLAADRRFSNGSAITGSLTKIVQRKKDGAMCGVSMNIALGRRFQKWFLAGERGERPELSRGEEWTRALVVYPGGKLVVHEPEGSFDIDSGRYAFGSGMEFALGAMAMGAFADRAVEIAAMYDANTGNGVDTLELPE
jgi:ATP-dependent HslUV protease subunit HslV